MAATEPNRTFAVTWIGGRPEGAPAWKKDNMDISIDKQDFTSVFFNPPLQT